MSRRGRRGALGPLVLVLLLAVVALTQVALVSRSRELDDLGRLRALSCARFAAESGVARVEAKLYAWEAPAPYASGSVPGPSARYVARTTVSGRDTLVRAEGECAAPDGHVARVAIEATLRRGPAGLVRSRWVEGPVAALE